MLAKSKIKTRSRWLLPFVLVVQHHRVGVKLAEIGQRVAFKAKSTAYSSCPSRTLSRRHGGERRIKIESNHNPRYDDQMIREEKTALPFWCLAGNYFKIVGNIVRDPFSRRAVVSKIAWADILRGETLSFGEIDNRLSKSSPNPIYRIERSQRLCPLWLVAHCRTIIDT